MKKLILNSKHSNTRKDLMLVIKGDALTGSSVGLRSWTRVRSWACSLRRVWNVRMWQRKRSSRATRICVQCCQHWRQRWAGLHTDREPASWFCIVIALWRHAITAMTSQSFYAFSKFISLLFVAGKDLNELAFITDVMFRQRAISGWEQRRGNMKWKRA